MALPRPPRPRPPAPGARRRTPAASPAAGSRAAPPRRPRRPPPATRSTRRASRRSSTSSPAATPVARAPTRLGRLQRPAPGEDGQAREQRPLGRGQQVVAPVERRRAGSAGGAGRVRLPPVSSRKRSSSRAAICATGSTRTRAAASSRARGSPSSRRQTSRHGRRVLRREGEAGAGAAGPARRRGAPRRTRPAPRRRAGSRAVGERRAGARARRPRPATPSGSRLVARTRSAGAGPQRARRPARRTPPPGARSCPARSSRRRRAGGASASVPRSGPARRLPHAQRRRHRRPAPAPGRPAGPARPATRRPGTPPARRAATSQRQAGLAHPAGAGERHQAPPTAGPRRPGAAQTGPAPAPGPRSWSAARAAPLPARSPPFPRRPSAAPSPLRHTPGATAYPRLSRACSSTVRPTPPSSPAPLVGGGGAGPAVRRAPEGLQITPLRRVHGLADGVQQGLRRAQEARGAGGVAPGGGRGTQTHQADGEAGRAPPIPPVLLQALAEVGLRAGGVALREGHEAEVDAMTRGIVPDREALHRAPAPAVFPRMRWASPRRIRATVNSGRPPLVRARARLRSNHSRAAPGWPLPGPASRSPTRDGPRGLPRPWRGRSPGPRRRGHRPPGGRR